MPRFPQALALCSCLLATAGLQAAEDDRWGYCAPDGAAQPEAQTPPLSTPAAERNSAPLEFDAGGIDYQADGRIHLSGQATATRADQQLQAETLDYDPAQGRLEARGEVDYREPGFSVQGDTLDMSLKQDQLELQGARYQLPASHAHGSAASLTLLGREQVELKSVSYTTCNPQQTDWELRAQRSRLDRTKGVGEAYNVQLRFKDVPIFYSPYLSFPTDDRRKSGFLAPSFGNSDDSGLELAAPYYLNIAPQRDLTLTPHYYQNRGLRLDTEFRYLQPNHAGVFEIEYLHEDRLAEARRGAVSIQQQTRFGHGWYGLVDLNHVSDLDYISDFSTNLDTSSSTHLDRRIELGYEGDNLRLLARAQAFQTIDRRLTQSDHPYRRLPQLLLQGELPWQPAGLRLSLDSEWVRFEHESLTTEGTRLDLWPRARLSWRTPAYFVEPSLSLRHTRYQLDQAVPGIDSQAERSLGIFSLDSGLIFERDLQWRGQALRQTLEPRLYYLRVPYSNQDALPVFDTGERDFSFDDLFRENRFSGADRMNDANQLSLAVSSRLLDAQGRERLRAALGQLHYFDDRRVVLPGATPADSLRSAYVGELLARPTTSLDLRATVQWDADQEQTRLAAFQLHYQPSRDRILNLGYRQRRGVLEQADVSVLWPLDVFGQVGRRWHVIGHWNYSIRDERSLETVAGLEYDSCCWALRAYTRRHVSAEIGSTDDVSSLSTYLQLELKGLTGIGKDIGTTLEHGILGYSQYRP